jgi:hypothetical protein
MSLSDHMLRFGGTLLASPVAASNGPWPAVERKAEYMFIGLGDLHTETACGTTTLATGTVIGGGPFSVGHYL